MKTDIMQETICYVHSFNYLPNILSMLEIELVILLTSEAVLATVDAVVAALLLVVVVVLLVVDVLAEPPSDLTKLFTVAWLTCWFEAVLLFVDEVSRLTRLLVLTFPNDDASADVTLLELF